jgi:hypothetical protein
MPTEVYPGIYVNGTIETGDGQGHKTVNPSAVTLVLADGWTVTLNALTGMQENSGDLDVVVTNRRIAGEEGAIRMKATCRNEARHLGWLVRRFTVVPKETPDKM